MTKTMNPTLNAALLRKGWNPEKVVWGRRVSGSVHGAEIEHSGETRYYTGPFVSIREGDQIAIVRWG